MYMHGGATAADERLDHWVWQGDHLKNYKKTRNGLLGRHFSSRLSPWLANGSVSARTVAATITDYEEQRVANEDTYWLLFELLWRDYFQFLAWLKTQRNYFGHKEPKADQIALRPRFQMRNYGTIGKQVILVHVSRIHL